ncbi:MAG: F420-dependent NADP oxidoreductase [Rikenellaceae bacterium]
MKRVVIIGSGGVAEALALGIQRDGSLELVQVWGRNEERVAYISKMCGVAVTSQIARGDVYIVSVSDRAISDVTAGIEFPADAVVVHTAGSVEMSKISHHRKGVLYPLQSFTPGRRVDLREVPFFVEGCCEEVTAQIEEVAKYLSPSVMRMDSNGRKRLHLCGVFASNFSNAMYAVSAKIAQESNIPFEFLKPLIEESCRKAMMVEDPRMAQTGPAVRGDKSTQNEHLKMLAHDETLKEIYKIISLQIWETSKKM